MSALGDRLRAKAAPFGHGRDNPGYALGFGHGLRESAAAVDEHEAAALAESAQGRGPHAALALRWAAGQAEREDVGVPDTNLVGAHTLRRWARQADQPPAPQVDYLGPADDEPPAQVTR